MYFSIGAPPTRGMILSMKAEPDVMSPDSGILKASILRRTGIIEWNFISYICSVSVLLLVTEILNFVSLSLYCCLSSSCTVKFPTYSPCCRGVGVFVLVFSHDRSAKKERMVKMINLQFIIKYHYMID